MYRIVGVVEGVRTEGGRTSLQVRDRRTRRLEWYPLADQVADPIGMGDWVEAVGGQDPDSLSEPTETTVVGAAPPEGAAPPPAETITLRWRDPETDQPCHQTMPLPTTIGRGSDAAVTLVDRLVSRTHARIEREGDDIVLTNRGANGTIVNGQREDRALLADGDIVQIGPFVLTVQLAAPAAPEHAPRVVAAPREDVAAQAAVAPPMEHLVPPVDDAPPMEAMAPPVEDVAPAGEAAPLVEAAPSEMIAPPMAAMAPPEVEAPAVAEMMPPLEDTPPAWTAPAITPPEQRPANVAHEVRFTLREQVLVTAPRRPPSGT